MALTDRVARHKLLHLEIFEHEHQERAMAGTPMLFAINVDLKNAGVKAFGKRVAAIAKTAGGSRFLTYVPRSGLNGWENQVVYIWCPDGPESADNLLGNQNPDAADELKRIAQTAGISHQNLKWGKQRMHRIAEHNRDAKNPPQYLALWGVKSPGDAKSRSGANTQSLKAGLKLLHQQAISKNPDIRYAAHKVGDARHAFVVGAVDSLNDLTAGRSALQAQDNSVDPTLVDRLTRMLPGGLLDGVYHKQTMEFMPHYSNF